MKRKGPFWVITMGTIVVLVSWKINHFRNIENDNSKSEKVLFNSKKSSKKNVLKNIEEIKMNENILLKIEFQTLINHLQKYTNRPYLENSENRYLDKLIKNDFIIKICHRILTDMTFTLKNFKDDQAIARVYAWKIIGRLAFSGDLVVLEKIIKDIQNEILSGKKDYGREYDLIDGLALWSNYYGIQKLIDEPNFIFSNFAYQNELRSYYATALRYSLTANNLFTKYNIQLLLTQMDGFKS